MALAAVVVLHLIVTAGHGWAHGAAGVALGWASLAFVVVVIQAAPLFGLAWMWWHPPGAILGLTYRGASRRLA